MAHPDQSPHGGQAVPDVERFLGYQLKRAYMVVTSGYSDAVVGTGLSPRVYTALSMIVATPQMTQSELSRRMGVERSGIVPIVDQLEKRGLATRGPVPGDRRALALSATEAGIAAHHQTAEAIAADEDALLDVLTKAERAEIMRILRKIRQKAKGPRV